MVGLSLVSEKCHCTIRTYIVEMTWIVMVVGNFIEVELQLMRQCKL
jgi:hypothetical protein